ncbi:MAG: glycogen debranching protein GlgX [Myxococcaceae bacterium]|nr:glycogen debranching protein GlgX [Myxococcaceae bacterium]
MSAAYEVWPGVPYPLGATVDANGVNFAFPSESATGITVCLFDPLDPRRELARLPLLDQTHHVFHGYVPHLKAGMLYGLRVDGPWAPERGLRFNPNKLLVDPWARAVSGKPDWQAPLMGHVVHHGKEVLDARDSSAGVPRSVLVRDAFDWGNDKSPGVLWRRAVVYEAHVKGLTQRHPDVPPHQRGTYAGLSHPAVIEHLVKLGVTSVELLPVHECAPEGFLLEKGLTNYWGYNTLGFFAPDQRFSSAGSHGQQVTEFKAMVKALHAAGLEVLLDVVYNHTCEGNQLGPTLSFRGLDNPTWYWLDDRDRSKYRDFTGCGNSLDARQLEVNKFIADSLRHWVTEFHVDGFRFDLATTLARSGTGEFDPRCDFFAVLHQDPVLSRVKLISEPWDVGPGGYRLGGFPAGFAEWNDRYRQTVRRFWRGDAGQVADLGYRLSGSSDFFRLSGRRPSASINYVTCHDGFTLRDLVSYGRKHNDANLEGNRDGTDENHSFNHGAEGDPADPRVAAARERTQKNLVATLLLSLGTPMLLAGDELNRTQRGNNNAYCQDSELSWVDWALDEPGRRLLEFTRRCVALRASSPVLTRRNFFQGQTLDDSRFRDVVWFHPSGREFERGDWENPELRCLGMFLGGDAIGTRDPKGVKIVGQSLLVWLNAGPHDVEVRLPPRSYGEAWSLVLETATDEARAMTVACNGGCVVPSRSLVVLALASP